MAQTSSSSDPAPKMSDSHRQTLIKINQNLRNSLIKFQIDFNLIPSSWAEFGTFHKPRPSYF